MTTAAALLAGVSLALGSGTGAELRRLLGYAMGGAALRSLYTTPVIYLYLGRLQIWRRPVPMADIDPGLRREDREGDAILNHPSDSEH
jgi:hypothetical protein